jgi:DNA-binding response OmpR family regulator
MAAHILIVDDDARIRKMLRRCLVDEGFRVSEATDGESVLRVLGGANVDLVTLDLNLGSTDGLAVAREIRQKYPVPIIMITGKGDVIDRIVGLEVGADDYVAKPFHLREVLARIRAVLRRHESSAGNAPTSLEPEQPPLHFDGWRLHLQRRELSAADGSICQLTSGEFDLLALLIARPIRVLTREQIMELLNGNDLGSFDRSIDNQIARLRKKIEADPADPRIIKTVRGAGYSFSARVMTA